jgi:hypothetical protein
MRGADQPELDAPPPPPRRGAPPAVAELQGLPLLEAVFPGRVLKVERPAPVADPGEGPTEADEGHPVDDAAITAAAAADADATDGEAIPLLTPLRRDP